MVFFIVFVVLYMILQVDMMFFLVMMLKIRFIVVFQLRFISIMYGLKRQLSVLVQFFLFLSLIGQLLRYQMKIEFRSIIVFVFFMNFLFFFYEWSIMVFQFGMRYFGSLMIKGFFLFFIMKWLMNYVESRVMSIVIRQMFRVIRVWLELKKVLVRKFMMLRWVE